MNNKIVYLEFLRVICAIVVVLDHICIAGIHVFDKGANCFEKFFYNGVQHWSHFAVPVFLMITGDLLLDNRREISYKKAWGKYAWRMVIVLLTIGTAFAWMEIFFSTKSWAPIGLMNALWNTIQGDTWKHFWYLYTLIGLYLVLPVIKPIFEKLNTRDLDVFLSIAFFFGSIMPTITSMTGIKLGISFPMSSIFLFYFMMGRRIGAVQNCDGIKLRIGLFTLFALSIVPFVCAYLEYYRGMNILEGLANYSSPFIVALGILFFYIIKSFDFQLLNIFKLGGG